MNKFGNKKSPLDQRGFDCYETPIVAVDALLEHETLPRRLWEPCCGPGNIVKYLRSCAFEVAASDIVNYGCPGSFVADFLDPNTFHPGAPYEAIITNPPFRDGDRIIRKALQLCKKVYIFQRLLFMEGQRRSDILDMNLKRVHLFKSRLPMMHRYGWEGKKSTSQVPYAWYVFERGYDGSVIIDRIDYKRKKKEK